MLLLHTENPGLFRAETHPLLQEDAIFSVDLSPQSLGWQELVLSIPRAGVQ